MKTKKLREGFLILLFWSLLWAIISSATNSLIVPSPIDTGKVLLGLLLKGSTYKIMLDSLLRVLISLLVGIGLGIIFGILAGINDFVKRLFQPFILITKAVPVVCFIIILWLYIDKTLVPSICGILLCFPIIYTNILEGFAMVDQELISMSFVYQVPFTRILRKLYFPSILPYLFAAILTSVGICWKATIAAEVISILDGSMGMMIYSGKVLLEFDSVFAWTVLIIFCSLLIELLTKYFINKVGFYERFEVT
ncbi:MAG: ABC transporter permease subunit [Spirochaetes bacterium]|nr:ABC transporter permease subunit [Spirochaetota bacterium]